MKRNIQFKCGKLTQLETFKLKIISLIDFQKENISNQNNADDFLVHFIFRR